MIAQFRMYEIYTAVNLHFKGSYDYFKFQGKTRLKESSYISRKDKYFFERVSYAVANEQEAIGLCVASIMSGVKYIKGFNITTYHKWIAYRDGIDYIFNHELKLFIKKRNENKLANLNKSSVETLMEMVISKELSQEFMILFNTALSDILFDELDKLDSFLWDDLKVRLKKYEPFIINLWNIDSEVIKRLKKIAIEQI